MLFQRLFPNGVSTQPYKDDGKRTFYESTLYETLINQPYSFMSMVEIREATAEDKDSAVRLMWKAFSVTDKLEDLKKEEWVDFWNQPEKEDWAFVAVDGKKIVANFCFFASEKNIIRGRPVRFAGVWAVATEPSYRRQGLITKLFEKTFPLMRERRCVLSILDPFSRPFYEKYGYALAEQRAKHILKHEHLKSVNPPSDLSIRELDDTSEITKLLEIEQSMTRFGSRFFTIESSFKEMINGSHYYLIERKQEPVGACKFWFSKGEKGEDAVKIAVGACRYKYDDILPAIVQLVQNHAVNCEEITWWTDVEVPIRHFIKDIHSAQTHLIGSMMMRVIDFTNYCSSINLKPDATEEVLIELKDKHCDWNSGIYKLIPDNGNLIVESSEATPEIKLSEFQLSQIIAGLTPVTQLRDFGEIICSKETASKLESIFYPDRFIAYQRF